VKDGKGGFIFAFDLEVLGKKADSNGSCAESRNRMARRTTVLLFRTTYPLDALGLGKPEVFKVNIYLLSSKEDGLYYGSRWIGLYTMPRARVKSTSCNRVRGGGHW
jgi:hypothetical protein